MSDKMVEETAKDYAAYTDVRLPEQLKHVHDAIEEMQTRLEEFGSLIGMVQIEGAKCTSEYSPLFRALRPQLVNLCTRIDNLERFIDRVNADLATLESDIDIAETDFGMTERRFGMLNPLSFFKKIPEVASSTRTVSTYRPPVLASANDYFQNSN